MLRPWPSGIPRQAPGRLRAVRVVKGGLGAEEPLEVAEVRRLKGKKILVGECGHASRTAKAAS